MLRAEDVWGRWARVGAAALPASCRVHRLVSPGLAAAGWAAYHGS